MAAGELTRSLKGMVLAGFVLPGTNAMLAWGWFLAVQVPYIVIHVLAVIDFLVMPFEVRRTLVNLFLANNGFQTTFRPLHLIYCKNLLVEFLGLIETPLESGCAEFDKAERAMRLRSKKRIIRFCSIIYIYNTIVAIGVTIPAIIRTAKVMYCNDKRELNLTICEKESEPKFIYDFWWFTDPFAVPTYYYLYWFNILMVYAYLLIFSTSDAFTCSSFVAVAERCKLLVKMAPWALVPGRNGEITPAFRAWVKYHQHYENLIQRTNSFLGPVVFVTHVLAAVNVMAYSYMAIKDEDETIRRSCLMSLIGLAIQFYLFAYAGQQIINKSEALSRAVFSATQVEMAGLEEGPVRSTLLIIMARCCGEKPEEITGLGFFTISMRFYNRIISIAASYLLFMLQLQ